MKKISPFFTFVASVICIVLASTHLAFARDLQLTKPTLRCKTTEITVPYGENRSITLYYDNTSATQIRTSLPRNAPFLLTYKTENSNAMSITITGKEYGGQTVTFYIADNPECAVNIHITVSPKPEDMILAQKAYQLSSIMEFNSKNDSFDLQFNFFDKSQYSVTPPFSVEILIVNDNQEPVYKMIHYLKPSDFDNSDTAILSIPKDQLSPSHSSLGTFSYTVYLPTGHYFPLQNYTTNHLPLLETNTQYKLEYIPTLSSVEYISMDGSVISAVEINDVVYDFKSTSTTANLHLSIAGKKVYDCEGDYHNDSCLIGWKLYDGNGYVIDSGLVSTAKLETGERFQNCELIINDLPPDTYTIKFINVE